MTDDIELHESDNEVDDAVHSDLVAAVTQIDGKQRVKSAVRNEPSLEISEFHLVKSGTGKKGTVNLQALARVLGKKSSHNNISQKIKALSRQRKTLTKPLEKPEANRIDREVRYDNVKKQLGRWDAVVQANRLSDHLTFPLNRPNIGLGKSQEFLSKFAPQTKLEVEMAKILNKGKEPEKEEAEKEESEFPMTLQEAIERRKELAKLRAQQSYREAKAHRQNKIKSKKYHRILRKEKVKQQLKDFEALKNADPEAALKQLDELDRTRAEERASLRHRSTGKWAKSKAIRAKYDTESRKVLAQQLSISRDLTQKIRKDSSDEENDDDEPVTTSNPSNNPWMGPVKTTAEIDEFIGGYRKYYEEQANKAREEKAKEKEGTETEAQQNNVSTEEDLNHTQDISVESIHCEDTKTTKTNNSIKTAKRKSSKPEAATAQSNKVAKKKKKLLKHIASNDTNDRPKSSVENVKFTKNGLKQVNEAKLKTVPSTSGKWSVSVDTPVIGVNSKKKMRKVTAKISEDIDDLFDDITDKIRNNVEKKFKKIESKLRKNDVDYTPKEPKNKDLPSDYLAFKKTARRPVLDEELNERPENQPGQNDVTQGVSLTAPSYASVGTLDDKPAATDIDPNKFISMKPQHLKTQLPDLLTAGEEAMDDDAEKQQIIMEAFADDDVAADFRKEKEELAKKDAPEDVSLAMPGWGSWGGKGIQLSKRKKRRFMVKKPVVPARKDSAYGDVIISEEKDKKMREHLVNALPFPFTSVKSYEASIRAPIGNTWVPETSFRKLTAPRIKTKMGTIIEPMDEDALVNKTKLVNGFK